MGVLEDFEEQQKQVRKQNIRKLEEIKTTMKEMQAAHHPSVTLSELSDAPLEDCARAFERLSQRYKDLTEAVTAVMNTPVCQINQPARLFLEAGLRNEFRQAAGE